MSEDKPVLRAGRFKLLFAVPQGWDEDGKVTGVNYYKLSNEDLKEKLVKPPDGPWKALVEMGVHMAHKEDKDTTFCGTFLVNLSAFHPKAGYDGDK